MQRLSRAFCSIVAAAGVAAAVQAQAPAPSAPQRSGAQEGVGIDPDPASIRAVTDFVKEAGEEGMAEVQLGRLALGKSQNERVRELAQQIVSDHERNNAALAAVAAMKNVSLPKALDAGHQRTLHALGTKQGMAFDDAYVSQTIAAHARAIALFTAAAGQSDSEIAAFAYRALPALKLHKRSAAALQGVAHE